MKKVRSHLKDFVIRMREMGKKKNDYTVDEYGHCLIDSTEYLLYRIIAARAGAKPKHNILLSGCFHGDELAGGLAIMKFLEESVQQYLDNFRFFAYPCVNPGGYDHNTAKNLDGINLNRQFKSSIVSWEISALLKSLKAGPTRYLFAMDMHEVSSEPIVDEEKNLGCWPDESFIYEFSRDEKARVGPKIIAGVQEILPVCKWNKICGDVNSGGVIYFPQKNGNPVYGQGVTFDSFLFENYTDHAFTTETPFIFSLEKRMAGQIKMLELALKYCS